MISEVKHDAKTGITTVTRILTEADEPCGKDTNFNFNRSISNAVDSANKITTGTLIANNDDAE